MSILVAIDLLILAPCSRVRIAVSVQFRMAAGEVMPTYMIERSIPALASIVIIAPETPWPAQSATPARQ